MRLLRLYPRAWRERYEAEMLAVLEQHDVTLRTRLDLLGGALDALFEQGRFVVLPSLRPAWRGARLGVIPSLFIVAQFVMFATGATMRFDITLVNAVGMGSVLGIFPLCFWAGLREERRGSKWRARIVAGAAAGMAAALISTLVQDGLVLLDVGSGITRFLLSLHGGTLYTSETFATIAGKLFSLDAILVDGLFALVAGVLGAATGALGAALGALAARLSANGDAHTPA